MLRISLFVLSIILAVNTVNAQAFSHVYGGYGYDAAYGVAQIAAPDSGYVLVGSTTSFGNNPDVYMIRTDKLGMITWTKNYGGSNIDRAEKVIQTQDEGFAIVGYTNSSGNGGYDVLLMKTDADGELLWEKTYGGEDWDFGYDIKETDDGDLILVGETFSFGSGDADVYVIKTNADGDTLWTRTYGGENTDIGNALDIDTENRIVVVGETNSFGEDYDGYVLRMDQDGDTLWTYRFDLGGYDVFNAIKVTQDEGYFLVGVTDEEDAFHMKFTCLLYKIDYQAEPMWSEYQFQGGEHEDYCTSADEFEDGFLATSAYSKSFVSQSRYSFVAYKLNTVGAFTDGFSRSGSGSIYSFDGIRTLDDGFAAVGLTDGWGNGAESAILIKVGNEFAPEPIQEFDDPFVSVNELSAHKAFKIFPNPVENDIHLESDLKNYTFNLYNAIGKLVYTKEINGKYAVIPRPKNLSSGLYVFNIIHAGQHQYNGKLIFR